MSTGDELRKMPKTVMISLRMPKTSQPKRYHRMKKAWEDLAKTQDWLEENAHNVRPVGTPIR